MRVAEVLNFIFVCMHAFITLLISHNHSDVFYYYRYVSRCLLIEFSLPQVDCSVSQFITLNQLIKKSSSALGYIVGLGEMFVKEGHLDIDEKISPKIKEVFGSSVSPRVQSCYGILMWFVLKVFKYYIFECP